MHCNDMLGVCDTREWGFNEALLFKITSFYGNEWMGVGGSKWDHAAWVAAISL